MLLCRKVTKLGFEVHVRYSPKHVFTVSSLQVDPVLPPTKGGKASDAKGKASGGRPASDWTTT